MSEPAQPDWTRGPGKAAILILLGGTALFATLSGVLQRSARPEPVAAAAIEDAGLPSEHRSPPPSAPASLTIDLNTAEAAELEMLPGIGPALASRIVEDRRANGPFRSANDLDRVKGIGPRTIAKLRAFVQTTPPASGE